MHFEVLVEDRSGQKMLEVLIPKIVSSDHTFRIIAYKGIGHIPANMKAKTDPKKRMLLDQLPRLLRGYGKTYVDASVAVILVCDLDYRCLHDFREDLNAILNNSEPRPEARFCIAIEEGEAWLLGDYFAIKAAYPNAKEDVLRSYLNDSICGTWEKLADAVYPGGSKKLKSLGGQIIGKHKSEWAQKIAPQIEIERNKSPSFRYFTNTIKTLIDSQ